MKLAVNYSTATADLIRSGQIKSDYFKCPAWPDLVPAVQEILPTYVHFPLKVGTGIGDAVDGDTNRPVDWGAVERLLAQTNTSFANVHFSPDTTDFPLIPTDTMVQAHIEMLTGWAIKDVQAVVKRFGAERVVMENDPYFQGYSLRPVCLPHVIGQIVEETSCGFLLDVAHARIAAHYLGMDAREYLNALPVTKIQELHISGARLVEGRWLELFRSFDNKFAERLANSLLDHLPMTDEDWTLVEWSMQQIRTGKWQRPWIVAFECGGVGPLWELVTDKSVLEQEIPRLYTLVKEQKGVGR